MASDGNLRSLLEALSGNRVGGDAQQRLVRGLPSAQRVEVDAFGGQVQFGAAAQRLLGKEEE